MAFDSLSDRLNHAMRNVVGKGKLTDKNMEDMLKEVRLALLEADVNYRIVKDFLEEVREKARGADVINSVEPGEMLVKIVHDQLVDLLGNEEAEIHFKEDGITSIMMVGLQGTGKTTSVAKIASLLNLFKLFSIYESVEPPPFCIFISYEYKCNINATKPLTLIF